MLDRQKSHSASVAQREACYRNYDAIRMLVKQLLVRFDNCCEADKRDDARCIEAPVRLLQNPDMPHLSESVKLERHSVLNFGRRVT